MDRDHITDGEVHQDTILSSRQSSHPPAAGQTTSPVPTDLTVPTSKTSRSSPPPGGRGAEERLIHLQPGEGQGDHSGQGKQVPHTPRHVRFSPQMVALQSKGSNSSLNNLRSSLATGDNPRRGSASGVYGLPVPPDNLKLGGTSNLTGDTVLPRHSKLST